MPSAGAQPRAITNRRFSCELPQPEFNCCLILPMQAILEAALVSETVSHVVPNLFGGHND